MDSSWTHHDNLLQGDGRLQTANGRLGQDRPDWLQRFARQLDQVVLCKVRLGGELKKHPVEIKIATPCETNMFWTVFYPTQLSQKSLCKNGRQVKQYEEISSFERDNLNRPNQLFPSRHCGQIDQTATKYPYTVSKNLCNLTINQRCSQKSKWNISTLHNINKS